MVLMADGSLKQIDRIRSGDMVLAADPRTGDAVGGRQVTLTHRHTDNDLVNLTLGEPGNDAVVHTTSRHPFLSVDGEWVAAGDLTKGVQLRSRNGFVTVRQVTDAAGVREMINLTVADLHTFYIMADQTPLLVHNTCGGLISRISQIADRFGVTEDQAGKAIHAIKRLIPKGAPVRNPDVLIDSVTGDVFPKLPDGSPGDVLGNIWDYLPGGP